MASQARGGSSSAPAICETGVGRREAPPAVEPQEVVLGKSEAATWALLILDCCVGLVPVVSVSAERHAAARWSEVQA